MKRSFIYFFAVTLFIAVSTINSFAIDTLGSDQKLWKNNKLISDNGRYTLVLNDDGNLVVYKGHNKPLWVSNTAGKDAKYAKMQPDGNFVIYTYKNKVLWHTNTHGNKGAYLVMQNDGNVVIYSKSGKAIWNSSTMEKN